MEYLKYDIESFNFKREKVLSDGNDERIKNNNFLVKQINKSKTEIEKIKKHLEYFTVFNFRLTNESFPVPIKQIKVLNLIIYTENGGKLLELDAKEQNVYAELYTVFKSYRTYKEITFNSSVSFEEANILLTESKKLEIGLLIENIEGNTLKIKNKITFKELNLNNIKDKDKITYRKVLQQTISLEKVS